MLTLTPNAADVVKTITAQSSSADDAGLRISQQESDPGNFALAPVEEPEPGDQIVEDGGARLFLDETAATALNDQVLDAQVDQNGSVQFGLGAQDQPG